MCEQTEKGHKLVSFSAVEIVEDPIDPFWYGNFGFKDENGTVVIEPKYFSCGEFSFGLCPVAIDLSNSTPEQGAAADLRWGYINEKDEVIIPFKYREAREFNKYGAAVVQDEYGEDHYIIDMQGNTVFREKDVDVFHLQDPEDRFFEFTKGGDRITDDNWGAYDTKEKRVFLEPITGGIIEWSEDEIEVWEIGDKGTFADFWEHYINSKGEELYPDLVNKGFNIVERPNKDGLVIVGIHHWEELKTDFVDSSYIPIGNKRYNRTETYGVANLKGELVIPAEYDKIYDGKDGSFSCYKGTSKTRIIVGDSHV